MTRLVARTRPVDTDVDPASTAGPDGFLWLEPGGWTAARGCALAIDVPAETDPATATKIVMDALGSISSSGPHPPRAFAAIPFRPGAAFTAVVPDIVVAHGADGSRWATTVARPGEEAAREEDAGAVEDGDTGDAGEAGDGRVVVSTTTPAAQWCEAVAEATRRIRQGDAVKVVLAREVVVQTPAPVAAHHLALKLHRKFPSCTTFAGHGLVGASPELLVSRHGDVVRSHPLAGTSPRAADPSADARLAAELLASEKDRWEHQITIDRVHETLLPFCSYLDSEAQPSVVAVANVQHLGTMVEGRLSDPPPSVLELALLLHPTPAVAGEPRAAALALIDELEVGDRGRWAGAVGWVDAAGDGSWMVAIRSAQLSGREARLWAGNGIVADSDPATELEETRAKLDAVLPLLIRP
jgi:menaquinone-specific isochorismate synthase